MELATAVTLSGSPVCRSSMSFLTLTFEAASSGAARDAHSHSVLEHRHRPRVAPGNTQSRRRPAAGALLASAQAPSGLTQHLPDHRRHNGDGENDFHIHGSGAVVTNTDAVVPGGLEGVDRLGRAGKCLSNHV